LVGITKKTGGLFNTKPTRKIIEGFAGNRSKNPMEVEFREASDMSKLTHLASPGDADSREDSQ
jgi:hypothetical protein